VRRRYEYDVEVEARFVVTVNVIAEDDDEAAEVGHAQADEVWIELDQYLDRFQHARIGLDSDDTEVRNVTRVGRLGWENDI
jgi:FKBP-type peptidyl-prolyl cis-trans isomerase (trigger factor)